MCAIRERPDDLWVCFTAFADILGYSEAIDGCNNDFDCLKEKLSEIRSSIVPEQKLLSDLISPFGGEIKPFSDSIFLNVPISSESPKYFSDGRPEICIPIEYLATYQYDLALKNYFIRGCATVNYTFFDDSVHFGSGLLEVVKCEKFAIYPRICLTEDLMDVIRHYCEKEWCGHDQISKYICADAEGKFFINYLYVVVDHMLEHIYDIPEDVKCYPIHLNFPEVIKELTTHKHNIERNIKKAKDSKVKDKYTWVAKYHNFFCQKYLEEEEGLIISGYDWSFKIFNSEK